jgi:hypothetical protein
VPFGLARAAQHADPARSGRTPPRLVRPRSLALPVTGTARTEGELTAGQALTLGVESDRLVIFGDGIEADAIELSRGQAASITLSTKTLRTLS